MKNHFDYLFDEPGNDFFQKHAEETAKPPLRVAPMVKTASAQLTGFEKLSGDIDGHLIILAETGPVGSSLGLTKRACDYFVSMCRDSNIPTEVLPVVFEKVAAYGIERDMQSAATQMKASHHEAYHEFIDCEIAKIGYELAKEASLATGVIEGASNLFRKATGGIGAKSLAELSGGQLAKAPGMFARDVGRVVGEGGAGVAQRAKAIGSGVAGGARSTAEDVVSKFRKGSLEKGQRGLSSLDEQIAHHEGALAQAKAPGGNPAARGYHESNLMKLREQRAAHATKLDAAKAKFSAGKQSQNLRSSAAMPGSTTGVPQAGAANQPGHKSPNPMSKMQGPQPVKAKTTAPESKPGAHSPTENQTAPSSGTNAGLPREFMKDYPGKAPEKINVLGQKEKVPLHPGSEEAAKAATPPPSPEGTAGKPSSGGKGKKGAPAGKVTDTLAKFHREGWGALSSAEKSQLVSSGVGVLGVHRLATGRDLISGDKND